MAVHSPNTGIVDWGRVAKSYAEDFKQSGGNIFTDFEVWKVNHSCNHIIDLLFPLLLYRSNGFSQREMIMTVGKNSSWY